MKLKRVYIEISNICNLSCAFCAKNDRQPRIMSLQEFEHIIKQVKPYCEYIYLHIKGEPLLHPHFNEIIQILNREKMHLQLVSNGTFINKYPDLINQECLRKVSISLHSIPYQPLMPAQYMKPLLDFAIKASNKEKPAIELRFWNRNKLDDKSRECLQMILNIGKLTPTSRPNSYKWMKNVYVHFDEEFTWPSNSNQNDTIGFCQGARTMIGILCDGTVVPCCLDDQGIINLGNIFESTLADILQGERFIRIKEGFQQRKLTEELCQKCSYRYRFNKIVTN